MSIDNRHTTPQAPQPDQQTEDHTIRVDITNAPTTSAKPASVSIDLVLDTTQATQANPNQPTNHVALRPGYSLNEYTLEAVLGAGGFGITYLARDNNLQCQVAIKEYLPNDLAVRAAGQTVLPKTESDTHGYQVGLDRFLAETRVLASFRHPNIVRVTRFFEANSTAYMVMDYEHGKSLPDWRTEHGLIKEDAIKSIFLPLLNGLAIVHQAGVIHRDIKPANIFVRDTDGSLVLLDFGAARETAGSTSRSLTSIITPGYAPFEQYHARGSQGPWTDIYALGGVLYWLVTGKKPLEAPSRIKRDTMTPAVQAGAGRFSHEFLAAIDWALNPDEEIRPRSIAEFQPVLLGETPVPQRVGEANAATPTSVSSAPEPDADVTNRKSGNRMKLAAAGAVVAVFATFAFFAQPKSSLSSAPAPALTSVTSVAAPAATNAAVTPAKPAESGATKSTDIATKKAKEKKTPDKPDAPAGGQVATLLFEIIPNDEYAEISVDDKKIGTAPKLKTFQLSPGKHKIMILGNKAPHTYYFWVDLTANEQKKISATFADPKN
jgi:serine/threonine protein kinase